MSHLTAVLLLVLLAMCGYAAGRLHGQFNYRCGYRQGYLDGDRAAWHRRHREAQATVAAVLAGPAAQSRPPAGQHRDPQP